MPAVLRPATAEQMIISHMTKKRGESTSLITEGDEAAEAGVASEETVAFFPNGFGTAGRMAVDQPGGAVGRAGEALIVGVARPATYDGGLRWLGFGFGLGLGLGLGLG